MQFSRDEFDFNELLRDAQQRWLKPAEVLFILQNHDRFKLTSEAPKRPPSGSLFLFNRKVLRFFRKDGYNWRKKRDGRTVGEAHERLKVGNVDALNCYYAHGEENPNFRRRSYWMLEEAYDHIVLVHYREVSEIRSMTGSMSYSSQNISFSDPQNSGPMHSLNEAYNGSWNSQSPRSVEEVSSKVHFATDYVNNLVDVNRIGDYRFDHKPEVKQTLRKLEEQLSLGDDDNTYFPDPNAENSYLSFDSSANNVQNPAHHSSIDLFSDQDRDKHLHGSKMTFDILSPSSFLQHQDLQEMKPAQPWNEPDETKPSSWKQMLEVYSGSSAFARKGSNQVGVGYAPRPSTNGSSNHAGFSATDDSSATISYQKEFPQFSYNGIPINHEAQQAALAWKRKDVMGDTEDGSVSQPSADNFNEQLLAARRFLLGSESSDSLVPPISTSLPVHAEITFGSNSSAVSVQDAGHCIEIVGRSNSLEWAKDLSISCSKYSPEYYGTLFDEEKNLAQFSESDSGLTLSQVQRFTIREISPDWAYSTEGSKVIIIGEFLCDPSESTWCCMFGDIEVPVEIIQKGVLRCQAPQHVTGKVSFCVTSGNRESCSEIREFEYRFKPHGYPVAYTYPQGHGPNTREELLLLVRFAQMVLHGSRHVSSENSVTSKNLFANRSKVGDNQWEGIIDSILDGSEIPYHIKDWLLEELLKAILEQWISDQSQNENNETDTCSLTKHEQTIIHMIAGLGYESSLRLALKSGIGVNFRDNNGWTALHWAARFGRERMVAALLAAGASAGAVTDPTSHEPVGKTAAAVAAAMGHKGLAAYLSETALTSHLLSLTLGETEMSKGSAALEAERTVESLSETSSIQLHMGVTEDQVSLKHSLAAVRNAAQAAARIQAAFRAHSFRRRQQKFADSYDDESGMTENEIREIVTASKLHRASRFYVRDHKLDTAATNIQRKYRSWKGRKDFVTLRRNVVKIQAHVRGHQVRKKYKAFVWTVGVLEKVILRWRRKGAGLRGFRSDQETIGEDDDEDILKVFRKQKVDAPLQEALSRVLSLVHSPDARQQYERTLDSYNQAKVDAPLQEALSRVLSLVHSPDARQQYERTLNSYNQAKAEIDAKGSDSHDSMEADNLNQFGY